VRSDGAQLTMSQSFKFSQLDETQYDGTVFNIADERETAQNH
jgi:hypothetical protein